MNALLRKEIRMVLPSWAAAMVLAIVPVWLALPSAATYGAVLPTPGVLVFAPFWFGLLLLTLTTFGQEFSLGTFSILMAQPVSRRRVWLTKIGVLALALLLAFIAFYISNHLRIESVHRTMQGFWRNVSQAPGITLKAGQSFQDYISKTLAESRHAALHTALLVGIFSVVASFAGGLWTTLFFRQISAAFWFSFLLPVGLTLLVGRLLENFSTGVAEAGVVTVLSVYSVAGFLWARRLFISAQDAQWTGGMISFPWWYGSAATATSRGAAHKRKPRRMMLRKEIQLQHVNLLLGGALLLLHLATLLLRRLGADYFRVHQSTALILESVPFLWLAMPLMAGSVAVAEERKLGTIEALHTLPLTRRTQFLMKFGVAICLGVFFGGVMPVLLEWLGSRFIPGGYRGTFNFNHGELLSQVTLSFGGSAGLLLLSFYGSTLTRSTLQALGTGLTASVVGVLLIVGAGLLAGWERFFLDHGFILWGTQLAAAIGFPVMTITVFWLAARNYKHIKPDSKVWRRNGIVLLVALISAAAVTTTVYHRAWEAWLPEEPNHLWYSALFGRQRANGSWTYDVPAQLSVKLQASSSRMALILPDRRLWLRQRNVRFQEVQARDRRITIPRPYGSVRADFVSGSDWQDVAVSDAACFAIRKDGSLWDLSKVRLGDSTTERSGEIFVQGHDWQKLSGGWGHFSALKSDGTLWEWTAGPAMSLQNSSKPRQVGTDTDWAAGCDSWDASVAAKVDGSIWRWRRLYASNTNGAWFPAKTVEQPEKWLTGSGHSPASISFSEYGAVAVVEHDGTAWLGGNVRFFRLVNEDEWGRAATGLIRWGNDADWAELKFLNWGRLVGVKRNGSLWLWDARVPTGPNLEWVVPPTRPSNYVDWVAVCVDGNAFLALARDGSLCLWGNPQDKYLTFDSGPRSDELLAPSRIKARRIAQFAR